LGDIQTLKSIQRGARRGYQKWYVEGRRDYKGERGINGKEDKKGKRK